MVDPTRPKQQKNWPDLTRAINFWSGPITSIRTFLSIKFVLWWSKQQSILTLTVMLMLSDLLSRVNHVFKVVLTLLLTFLWSNKKQLFSFLTKKLSFDYSEKVSFTSKNGFDFFFHNKNENDGQHLMRKKLVVRTTIDIMLVFYDRH